MLDLALVSSLMVLRWLQNAELFTLTYGAIVRQLLTDLEEVEEVNKQLDQMYVPTLSFFSPVNLMISQLDIAAVILV